VTLLDDARLSDADLAQIKQVLARRRKART
jgi:hypothetical protein